MSFLELHLHLGTAWSRFRPRAEWGAGWGQWRLFLLAGCSAPRKEGGARLWAPQGVGCGPQRLALSHSEADRSACRGDGGGAGKRLLLGGLEKASTCLATLLPPRVLHLSAFHVPHLWALPWPPWSARAGAGVLVDGRSRKLLGCL